MSLVRLRRPRVWNTLREACLNVTDLVDGASEHGSSAPATARHYGFQLPLLLKSGSATAVVWPPTGGHAQLVAGAIETGQAPGEGEFSASLVRIVRDHTSRLVAAPRKDALQAWTYHWTCCHGETIADWPCCGHVRGTDTAARSKGTGIGSIDAGRPSCGSGWRIEVTVGPYWLLAPNG